MLLTFKLFQGTLEFPIALKHDKGTEMTSVKTPLPKGKIKFK